MMDGFRCTFVTSLFLQSILDTVSGRTHGGLRSARGSYQIAIRADAAMDVHDPADI